MLVILPFISSLLTIVEYNLKKRKKVTHDYSGDPFSIPKRR